MKIAIDGSRAFIKKRTGIEEYSYQTILHLRQWMKEDEVFLYIRKNQEVDFDIPTNWKIKKLWFPRFWTQIRLSIELALRPVDVLFVPAHTVPIIHPKKTIVVIHGLEYEFCPKAYSLLERIYMRIVIKNSCKWASKIVCVSENTKKDLARLYDISEEKMAVIREGFDERANAFKKDSYSGIKNEIVRKIFRNNAKYIFFVGRIGERKNISNLVRAFDILKEKYGVPHKLVLAGKPGYGYKKISNDILKSKFEEDIIELGYISDHEKWVLLKRAELLAFPSFYEGFGLPILEAQNALIPVIASNMASIPEVAGDAALYCDPNDFESMAENMQIIINNEKAREDIIKRGYENSKKFSWSDCSRDLFKIIKD